MSRLIQPPTLLSSIPNLYETENIKDQIYYMNSRGAFSSTVLSITFYAL